MSEWTGTLRAAVGKVDETLRLVRSLDHIIRGNGKPEDGLAFRVRKIEDWVDQRRADADTDRDHGRRLDRIEGWMESRQRIERTLANAIAVQAVLVISVLVLFVVRAFVFTGGDPSAIGARGTGVYYHPAPAAVEVGQGPGSVR